MKAQTQPSSSRRQKTARGIARSEAPAELSADGCKVIPTRPLTGEPTVQLPTARVPPPPPTAAAQEESPKRQRKKRKRGMEETPAVEHNERSAETNLVEGAEGTPEPPEKSQAIEDCEDSADAGLPPAQQRNSSQELQDLQEEKAVARPQSSRRQLESAAIEKQSHDWKEGARIGEASNSGPPRGQGQQVKSGAWRRGENNTTYQFYFRSHDMQTKSPGGLTPPPSRNFRLNSMLTQRAKS